MEAGREMTPPTPSPAVLRSSLLPLATAVLALGVFAADALTPADWVFSGFYVLVVVMAGRFCRARGLWAVSGGCSALTVLAQFIARHFERRGAQIAYIGAFNTFDTIVVIELATYFILRGQSANAALQRAQADLARVSRVTTMGELTASIAHEVNQPIAAVVTNAGACLRWLSVEAPDLEKARAAASRIVRDGTRAAEIITRIRQVFAKGASERRPVNLNQLAQETLDLLGNEAARHAISVRADLAGDIPPVWADPVQLQQVVVNLVMNGVEAMKDIQGIRELCLETRRSSDGEVVVSVYDTGVGLPPQPAEQLFEAFVTTKPQGTGLGLSISRTIVEAHGGRLWTAANAPRGAIFRFTAPVVDGVRPAASALANLRQ